MIEFGTGGWRAIIGDTFIKTNIVQVAQAIAHIMKEQHSEKPGIVIGYDSRFLSDKAAKWLAEVFAAYGIHVYYMERYAPTPLIMYATKQYDVHYGIAVTASHNSADYNGIKVFTKGGKDADETITDLIESFIGKLAGQALPDVDFKASVESGRIEIIYPLNDYLDTLIHQLDVASIREKRLKILLDPMFGVSKTALQAILVTARCEVDTINDRHDTMFGGRLPSPSAATLSRLSDLVVEKGYDLGIGTDGDADRLGVIDEKGHFIHPNKIMALLYYYLLHYKGLRGPAVRNIATTHLLDRIAEAYGQTCYEVPVGFKHISSGMDRYDAIIGGESSGGLTIKGHLKGKDGIFAAGLLVEMMSTTGKRLAEMLESIENEFGAFEMVEANLAFPESEKARLVKLLYEDRLLPTFDYKVEKVSYLDGVKVYFESGGWLIARFSGTEPLVRIFAEMPSEALADELAETMKSFMAL